ncbi:MAG: ABC transporter substrate-binding protein [Syntrophomonadaceae bacterium]|nr:ABC transporter substrate-binding protein [Syntrophomonadaceae bacterium]
MNIKQRRAVVVITVLGCLFISILVFLDKRTTYTANLDQRTFNLALVGTIDSLEPALLDSHPEKLLAAAIYEGLVYYDDESKSIKPLLVSDWKYSSDGKSLTLNLKRKISFHNGKRIEAADVKRAWENSFSTTKEWSNISLFLSIQGSQERLDGKSAEISGIQVINPGTIKMQFEQPNAAFIFMLTNPVFWVYDTQDKVEPAPGSGPYKIKEIRDKQQYLLERNEKYHRGMPALGGIKAQVYAAGSEALAAYQAGGVDYLDSLPLNQLNAFKENPQYKKLLITKPLYNIYFLGFNVNREPFAGNYLLRRALNYGVDKDLIIDEVMGGSYRAANSIIPLGMAGYQHDMTGYSYDPEKAQELLEEAGFPLGEGLPPLLLTYNQDPGHQMVVESIVAQLAELGIKVKLQPLEWNYYKKQMDEMNLVFFRLEWKADYPDPDSLLYSMFHSSKVGMGNYFNYHNSQVDKILDASREEVISQQERIKLLNRAEQIIIDDAPALLLFQSSAAVLAGQNTAKIKLDGMQMIDWYEVELLKPAMEKDAEGSKEQEKV